MRKARSGLLGAVAALSLAACAAMEPVPVQAAAAPEARASTATGTYLAGKFAAAEGDITSAAKYYAEMLKDDPNNIDLLIPSFLWSTVAGDVAGAVPIAERVVALDPDNRRAHLVLAANAFVQKDYVRAQTETTQSGRGPFAALTSAVLEAWALAGQGKTDDALTALNRLADQMGVEGLHAFHKALILEFGGRVQEADTAYREAIATVGAAPRTADAYGRFLMRQNRTEEAKALYTRMAAQNAGNPIAAAALADIENRRQTGPLVSSPAEGAAEGLFAVSASLNGENTSDVTLLYLNLAVYMRPDFDLARALLGDRYERVGRHDTANEVYGRVPQSSPYFPMVQVQSAINTARMGRSEEAIARMRALAQQRPNDGDAWTALGDLLRNSDKFADAIPAYDRAIALLPNTDTRLVSLHYARGIAYQQSGNWDAAETDFQRALALNPNRADVLNYLGYSWIERGKNLDEAVKMLEKARSLRPNDGYIADSVGWAYYKLGRYQEAAEILEEAVQLAPGASEINDHLGDAYWRIGRRLDARFEWRHALRLNPEPSVRPIIEKKLQLGLEAALSGT